MRRSRSCRIVRPGSPPCSIRTAELSAIFGREGLTEGGYILNVEQVANGQYWDSIHKIFHVTSVVDPESPVEVYAMAMTNPYIPGQIASNDDLVWRPTATVKSHHHDAAASPVFRRLQRALPGFLELPKSSQPWDANSGIYHNLGDPAYLAGVSPLIRGPGNSFLMSGATAGPGGAFGRQSVLVQYTQTDTPTSIWSAPLWADLHGHLRLRRCWVLSPDKLVRPLRQQHAHLQRPIHGLSLQADEVHLLQPRSKRRSGRSSTSLTMARRWPTASPSAPTIRPPST